MRITLLQNTARFLAQTPVADKARFQAELQLMAGRTSARPALLGDRPGWVEVIERQRTGRRYMLALTLPPRQWPWQPPQARILTPRIASAPHRYADGHLCLFAPSTYRPSISFLYVRARAVLWIACFEDWQQTGVWPADEWS